MPVAPAPPVSRPITGAHADQLVRGRVRGTPPPRPANDPTTDPLTGLLMATAWSRIVVDEEARIRRYHRPATIVIIEIEGLDRLVARLGPSSVDRIVPAVADTLRRGAREADHVARLATGRFAILMPETDEILAINYVERVRKACDLWLESGAVSLRLAIGWASSTGDGSLVDAEALATDRMYGELRRAVAREHARCGRPVPRRPTAAWSRRSAGSVSGRRRSAGRRPFPSACRDGALGWLGSAGADLRGHEACPRRGSPARRR